MCTDLAWSQSRRGLNHFDEKTANRRLRADAPLCDRLIVNDQAGNPAPGLLMKLPDIANYSACLHCHAPSLTGAAAIMMRSLFL